VETCEAAERETRILADAINPEGAILKKRPDGSWFWPYEDLENEIRVLRIERADHAAAKERIASMTAEVEHVDALETALTEAQAYRDGTFAEAELLYATRTKYMHDEIDRMALELRRARQKIATLIAQLESDPHDH
jgi:hypothetical protein